MSDSILTHRTIQRLYRDSVVLMTLAAEMEACEGVIKAGAVMATPSNLDILGRSQMLPEGLSTQPDDLLLVVRAQVPEQAQAALDLAQTALEAKVKPQAGGPLTFAAKTIDEALESHSAELVTISVPGVYAAAVAEKALNRGCNVFCFSDNVPLEEENRLKSKASAKNLLMMGPDCGTAVIDGVPLGFANALPEGPVGIVSASGTGAQEVSALLAEAGIGTRHIVGVGGRDLSGNIEHPATFIALSRLEADPAVELIAVVSKPPAAGVARQLLERLASLSKPALACLLGEDDRDTPVTVRGTLEGAAIAIAAHFGAGINTAGPGLEGTQAAENAPGAQGGILGLYTGGTLAHEARILCERAGVRAQILDLGDDTYTQGRPHPMISPELRSTLIAEAGSNPEVGVLLLDLVIGWGASSDPATPVAEAVQVAVRQAAEHGRTLVALASVTGTSADHQGLHKQQRILEASGIYVFPTNAAAVRAALALAKGGE